MAETRTTAFDLNDPAVIADPYPHYARLREEAPVHHCPDPDLWILSRYDDVLTALRDTTRFSSNLGAAEAFSGNPFNPRMSPPRWLTWPVERLLPTETLLTSDPPVHTRLRKKVNRAFAPRRIAALETRIRALTDDLADALCAHAARGEPVDVVHDLAGPLPTIVIAELMGIPPEHRDAFKRWSDDLIDGLLTGGSTFRMLRSAFAITRYFARTVRRRRRKPGDDLISLLVTPDADGALTTLELILFCVLLLVGGNETTTNLIANAMDTLLDHPESWHRLTADPTQATLAVEETLRYQSPAQALLRVTTTNVALQGITIPTGSRVLPLIGSAHRDPRHWQAPDTFELDRKTNGHLAFGTGIHYCIANALARLEARIALETLARRTPGLTRAGTPTRIPSPVLRGLRTLPVAVEP
ncbi:cytochrome P450 [Nocardia huaxiensis]|uniref:Cytochrome P450 n=1 Tax=Nocardia huaxiensis TaxID=2755382 RepID=A0A7D6ZNZ7_9NOCA|nr:cytochrome P450 [Nocardia huaxiensis]QLY30045.1 cytochrome P450 [Nocardia huaxiensis]